MSVHFQKDLENLKKEITKMGSMVEESINNSIRSLIEQKLELASKVIDSDSEIDKKEILVEEECLKILALHQPVAGNLRFVVAVLKLNNDLERMGDLAVNIAERSSFLCKNDPISLPLDFQTMVDKVQIMVNQSLLALFNKDVNLAREVCQKDDEVDEINREMFTLLQDFIKNNPNSVERAVHTLSASRHLERIADHATNISEDVIYMIEGDIVRHLNHK